MLNLACDLITSVHTGFKRTLIKTKKNYFLWGQYKHTLNYIKSYVWHIIKRRYQPNQKTPLQRVEIALCPFEKIAMDTMDSLTTTSEGNKHITVISEYFTRWVEAYPAPNLMSETITSVLETFIGTHKISDYRITDRV